MARWWAVMLVVAVALLAGCNKGSSRDERAKQQSDIEKFSDQVANVETLEDLPTDLQMESEMGTAMFKALRDAQQSDRIFTEAWESFDVPYYFEDANLADARKRKEFRGKIGEILDHIEQYRKRTHKYWDDIRAAAEKADGKKYPNLNQDLRAKIDEVLDSQVTQVKSYLAIVNHLDSTTPRFVDGEMKFDSEEDLALYGELYDRSTVAEEAYYALSVELEAMRKEKMAQGKADMDRAKGR
jgi:hypothetical protein